MSFRAMIWAWEVEGLTSTTKLVLLSLAQHANEDGAHAFPSVATIGAECRLSERAVQNALRALEAEGYITVMRRLRQSSVFSLRMDLHVVARRAAPPAASEGAPGAPIKGAPDSPQGARRAFEGAPGAPEPVLEPILEPADAGASACASESPAEDDDGGLFGAPPAAASAPDPALAAPPPPARAPRPPAPGPLRDTPQQPAPPGYRLPFNPYPHRLNFAPIPPEPAGDPQRWMPRLSDPEHRWSCLAPGEEIDPKSMTGARRQCRGGWILRDIAQAIAEAMGWHDPRRYTDWRPLCAWLDDGIDPHDTILPTVRRIVERRGNLEISTLAYFDRAVREAGTGRRRAG